MRTLPEIDLSTLDGAELRGLLASVRQRGQAAQSYQILQELAERRAQGGSERRPVATPAEPRVIAVDLGDPLDRIDDDAELYLAPAEPLREAEEDDPLVLEPASGGRRPKDPPPRRRGFPVLTFSLGVMIGLLAGFGIAYQSMAPAAPAKSVAVFPAAPGLRIDAASPPDEPAAPQPVITVTPPPAPIAPTEPAAAVAPPPAPAPPEAQSPPAPTPVSTPAVATPPAAEAASSTDAEGPAAKVPSAACAKAPTPADKVICGDARLQRLQADLRAAYATALGETADKALLRQRQLAWRDARNGVTDPAELARLYEARTRRLKAAAAAAVAARAE
jgi:uncharacterized protein YecT (DUF1311 family)